MASRRSAPEMRLELTPIGVIRSPFLDRHSAPRQPSAARGVAARIELFESAAHRHALEDLETWSHIWVIFWFHRNPTWHPKVLPPRSERKRGVFATRAPHRPNPLGLSVVRLMRVEGTVLHVSDVDMLDQTPVLDLKPYVPYCDLIPAASSGWLARPEQASDPQPAFRVRYNQRAERQLAWLAGRAALDLRALATEVLSVGPTPHPYRRIKRLGSGRFVLGVKDFRLQFSVLRDVVTVHEIESGYRAQVLRDHRARATEATPLEVHRAFRDAFERER